MSTSFYFDHAQICENGHVINIHIGEHPECNADYCPLCGAKVLSACPQCERSIPGSHNKEISYLNPVSGQEYDPLSVSPIRTEILTQVTPLINDKDYVVPAYCPRCGAPYPWTAATLAEGERIVDALDELPPDKKEKLKSYFPDLIIETPRSHLAVLELAKILDCLQSFGKPILVNWLSQNMLPILYALLQSLKNG